MKNRSQSDQKSSKVTSWGLLKVVEKSSKNRWKIDQKSVKNRPKSHLGASWGLLRASWQLDHTIIEKSSEFGSLPDRLLGTCWPPKKIFYVKNFSKRRPGRAREAIFEVSKNKLNIEGSWDRFSIDFWRVLAPPGKDKMCAPLRREWNFEVFASSNISYLLESKKHRFWEVFGTQVGYRKRVTWVQEASWAEVTNFFGGPKEHSQMSHKKCAKKSTQENQENQENLEIGVGVP